MLGYTPPGTRGRPTRGADNPPYPVQSMLGYTGNKAGGMYPTGMHTCSTLFQEHIDVCALRSPKSGQLVFSLPYYTLSYNNILTFHCTWHYIIHTF